VGYRRKVFDIAGMKNENKALALTPQEFVQMGAGSVAYVKAINLRGRSAPLPASPAAPPRRQAASAHRRRRLTLMLTASKDAAIANAWEHELKTVSLH
jgi:hypothetical protein